MTIIIVGGGRVGLRTARTLAEEGYGVVIVELDPEKVTRIQDEGFRVIQGDGADENVLEQAGIETAEAIAGLTPDINVNFAACMIGTEYGCRTVLRLDEDYREEIYHKYAEDVDEVIYPERLGAAGAKTALLGGNFNLIADLTERLQLLSVTIPPDAPVIGGSVNELHFDDARIYAHGREHEPLTIPLPGTRFEANDRVAIIAERGATDRVRSEIIGKEEGSDGDDQDQNGDTPSGEEVRADTE
ncbi:MAG: TrkA family potassium uptake protein [Halobacteriales archaeon]|nr:TrkA family potassium uptake protein [Halobacteriales archaeon]